MPERKLLSPLEFPSLLREINDPPKKLYVEGTLPPESDFTYLAVVGSRRFSHYAKDACESLIAGLAGYPIAIVSGLALGIDAIAHRAAMKAGLPTIAVPGSGLDRNVLYPRTNLRLAEEILENGGALLSEFEPNLRAALYTFPQRNRIMAGLCKGILVAEAGERSGTLITARLALEYNRDVFVIPGPIFSPTSSGSNELLKHGAMPVTSCKDLIEALGFEASKPEAPDLEQLSPQEKKIIDLLIQPLPRDVVFEEAGLTASQGNVILITMELKGLIQETGGELHRTW